MNEPLKKHVIFIVDDDEMVRSTLARVLHDPSYELFFFGNPIEALARIDELCPVLITSDNVMPKMTGFQFLRKVRSEWPAIRTLMLTGGHLSDAIRVSVTAGEIDRLIEKPWGNDLLRATVRELIGSK